MECLATVQMLSRYNTWRLRITETSVSKTRTVITVTSIEWSKVQIGPRTKRVLLNVFPSAMSAYLRKERVQWSRQLRQNKQSVSGAVRSRAFSKALTGPLERTPLSGNPSQATGLYVIPRRSFGRCLTIHDSAISAIRGCYPTRRGRHRSVQNSTNTRE